MYSNSSLYLLMSHHMMSILQLVVTWAEASDTTELYDLG